ncbi:MAG: peptidoglycan D,D-transpeptidase FtsI family protein [Erysipelotrichaceae bacterium]
MFKNPFKKLDQDNARRQSDALKRSQDFSKSANDALRNITIVVICIFLVISGRLVYIQINQQEEYLVKLEAYNGNVQVVTTPRGRMLDSNGNVVVDNVQNLTLTYYPQTGTTSEDEWVLADKIAKMFDITGDELTQRDLKDLYILLDENNGNDKLTEDELLRALRGELTSTYTYNLILQRITEEDLANFDEELLSAYAVKQRMNMAPSNEVKTIIENLSSEDAAYMIEHQDEYPGFDIAFDWKRDYPYGSSLSGVLGRISTKQQGLPAEQRLYYQALGYSLNERIGTSGLEAEYEELLNGTQSKYELVVDKNTNKTFLSELEAGKNGYDLQLSIDMDLQTKFDEILTEILEREENNQYRKFFDRAYITMMNPNTGEVYAMSSVVRIDGKYYDNSSGVYLDSNVPGSIVKGATVYMGLNEGVIQPGEVIVDAPIYLQGTPPKASYKNYGPLNDILALQNSSNVYMFHIAMRLGGTSYVPNGPLIINSAAFDLMRSYYNMFGLGVETGLDVPYEETGYMGSSRAGGLLLDFAIGQYDSYTTMQMLQYVATIANGGYRIKPRLVTRAYEPNSVDTVVYENEVEILSSLVGDTAYLDRVKQGFRACVTSGNCGGMIRNLGVDVAAKTGTAEEFVYDNGVTYSVTNTALIGFAPYDNPTVAFACEAPRSSLTENLQSNICMEIVGKTLEEFFKKY